MSRLKTTELATTHLAEFNAQLELKGHTPVNSETFCSLPFSHLSTTTDGEIRLCCRSRPIGNIKNESLSDVWFGDKMKTVRQDLINGTKVAECKACWDIEKKGMVSLRMGQNIRRLNDSRSAIVNHIEEQPVAAPVNLELKLSNMCNLRCRMCSPAASTQWFRDWEKVRHHYSDGDRHPIDEAYSEQKAAREPVLNLFLKNEKFISDLHLFKDSILELEFAGGEPLIDPLHYEVLKLFMDRASEVSLKYSTNLTILKTNKYDVFDFWKKFKQVHLTVSIDGYPALNNYIRAGSKMSDVEKNIEVMRDMPNVTLKTSTCVSSYNALYLAETFEYILGLDVPIYYNRVQFPDFLDARTMPMAIRQEAVKKLRGMDPAIIERTTLSSGEKVRCARVIEDCIEWLSDDFERSPELYQRFTSYVADMDLVHKNPMREIEILIGGGA